MERIRIAVLGASGYTGAELLRILLNHPYSEIRALTADKNAGLPVSAVFPHFSGENLPHLSRIEDVNFDGIDLVFLALPHGEAQKILKQLPEGMRAVDLSADFRFEKPEVYEKWYGKAHIARELQKQAVYGLAELKKEKIKGARIIANPGCYPTAPQLALMPLLKTGLIEETGIVIDAKSGVSGAGRELKRASLFCEAAEGLQAYGIASHRHSPEIDQGLSEAAGRPVICSFTPHLVPMNRGIFESIYVNLKKGVKAKDLHSELKKEYSDEPFIELLDNDNLPSTRFVRGTNNCQMKVIEDRIPGKAIILCALDNLMKGASGQAVQNMNIMFDFEETAGLTQTAIFP